MRLTPCSARNWRWVLSWIAIFLQAACAAPGHRAVTGYIGAYTDNSLPEEILPLKSVQLEPSQIFTVAYAEVFHEFSQEHGRWEWETQVAQHFGAQPHTEFNGLLVLRWRSFPWNEYMRTSGAIGYGLSWATEIPKLEESSHTNEGATQLLSYLLLEWTLGLPTVPDWDLVLRIHHRSGVYGTFDGVHGGSNVLGLGLKYAF
ncbi:MAG: hypothetical protein ACI8X5_003838 [Planctomycetota bacterium]|jgi:hypothetical protein